MLKMDVIEPSQTEWAAPIVMAPKKDGALSFIFEYRKLNAVTVSDYYHLPRMHECSNSLGDARAFLMLDANSVYW